MLEKPRKWRLVSDFDGHASTLTPVSAGMNMAIDETIAKSCSDLKPTIRFYTWSTPAVSIGYSQRIMPVVDWLNHDPTPHPFAKGGNGGVHIVRRPTGGGTVLHGPVQDGADMTGLTYSVSVPVKSLATSARNLIPLFYREVGRAVIEGLRSLGIAAEFCTQHPVLDANGSLSFCSQTPVESDVMVKGTKVAGCGAHRFKDETQVDLGDCFSLLLQGYISIGHLLAGVTTRQLTGAMAKGFASGLDIELEHGELTGGEFASAKELNDKKYSRNEWNYKR